MSSMFPPEGALPGPTPNGGPSLQDILGGAGAAPPSGGPPPGPPMAPLPPLPQGGGSGDPTSLLREIQKMIQSYIGMESTDDLETKEATKISDLVQSLLASEQKENEAAMGTTPAHKAMARQAKRGY